MGRKGLPIHESAMRDIQTLTSLHKRIQEVQSKHITDEERKEVETHCVGLTRILEIVHRRYWGE